MRNTLGGLRPWLRDRPLLADAVVAVLLAVVAVSSVLPSVLPFARDGSPDGPAGAGRPAGRPWPCSCWDAWPRRCAAPARSWHSDWSSPPT